MVTKEEETGGRNGAPVTPKPLRRPWETGKKLKKSCFNPGPTLATLRVSAFPETDHSMRLSELSSRRGEASVTQDDTAALLWRMTCRPPTAEKGGAGATFPRGFGANDVKHLGSLVNP